MMQQKTYSCFQCGSRARLRSRIENLRRKGCNGQNKAHYINQSAEEPGQPLVRFYIKRTTSSHSIPARYRNNRHSFATPTHTVCHLSLWASTSTVRHHRTGRPQSYSQGPGHREIVTVRNLALGHRLVTWLGSRTQCSRFHSVISRTSNPFPALKFYSRYCM